MAKKRKAWVKGPEKKTTSSMSDPLKAEGESKAAGLIENVLKPKHILPPKEGTQFNYITDIGTKWYRNDFSFISTYTCPGPNATSPTFEEKFARMEHLGNDKFTLSDMRHTEAWVCLFDNLSVDDCMKSIQNDPWFMP